MEIEKRLGAISWFSTLQYPQSNGLEKHLNQLLKRMLHHTFREEGKGCMNKYHLYNGHVQKIQIIDKNLD